MMINERRFCCDDGKNVPNNSSNPISNGSLKVMQINSERKTNKVLNSAWNALLFEFSSAARENW